MTQVKTKKKIRKSIPVGVAHIQTTFNNTIVSITDPKGEVTPWCSAGTSDIKGAKKSPPFAAQIADPAEGASRRYVPSRPRA